MSFVVARTQEDSLASQSKTLRFSNVWLLEMARLTRPPGVFPIPLNGTNLETQPNRRLFPVDENFVAIEQRQMDTLVLDTPPVAKP